MVNLTDEMLMAYADGELQSEERTFVEAILERDPAARARLAIFVSTGRPLAALYKKPMLEKPPADLVKLVLFRGIDKPARPKRKARYPWSAIIEWVRRLVPPLTPVQTAFASIVLLAAGMVLGWLLRNPLLDGRSGRELVALENGRLFARGALQRALETAQSGREVKIDGARNDAVAVRIVLTFKSKAQTFCREYEVETAAGEKHAGLSCRDREGRWALHVHVPTGGLVRSGLAGGVGTFAIDAIVEKIIEGDAFDAKDETAVMNRKWR